MTLCFDYDMIKEIPPVALPSCITEPMAAVSSKIGQKVTVFFSGVYENCKDNYEFLKNPGKNSYVKLGRKEGRPTYEFIRGSE